MNEKMIWSNFLNSIKNEITPLSFDTWFKETELFELKDGLAKIIVPMGISKKHLTTHYYDLIVSTLSDILGDNVDIQFFLKEELEEVKNITQENLFAQQDFQIGSNPKIEQRKHQSNLKPEYTFENFIVGNSNKFAQAAALDVAENPGNI